MPRATRQSIDDILRLHKTSPHGLTSSEAKLRLGRVGLNVLESGRSFAALSHFAAQFTDPMIGILLVAVAIALIFGQFRDAGILSVIILLNAVIGFTQEYKTERTLGKLRTMVPRFARVWRNETLISIERSQLAPGDVIDLAPGDQIPADCSLIAANDLRIDESALTGESLPVRKIGESDQSDPIFMGTIVRNGTGQAVVTGTGKVTRFGELAHQVATTTKDRSPLTENLNQLAHRVAFVAAVVFVLVFVYGILTGQDTYDQFFFALALAAAVVPEGLPATVSVVLALAANRLAKKHALVKRLTTIETLAAVTVICTDKTGTLTENRMTVERVWIAPSHKPTDLQRIAICANNAHLDETPTDDLGDPMEIALARWAAGNPSTYLKTQMTHERVRELPFSEDEKKMSVIVRRAGRYLLLTKGAPERIFEDCHMSRAIREKADKQLLEWTNQGYRVLALAQRPVTKLLTEHRNREHLEMNMTFIGLVALLDPPRAGVVSAIAAARGAGMRVMMITGDNAHTATSLARRVGILRPGESTVINGDELDLLDDEGLMELLDRPAVFARVTPEHKLRIVNLLKRLGDTVAVTGDGVNDGPALKRADVGIAMGETGTDVAREAADMILLDDHFGTLLAAIEQSRLLFTNLKKTIWYAFAANSAELFTLFMGAIAQLPLLPIQAVQILAIDLGTDVLPSFALATDPPHHRLLSEAPHPRDEELIDSKDLRRLILFGVVVGIGGLVSFWHVMGSSVWGSPSLDLYGRATFAVYATIVLCQIANMFAARSATRSIFRLSLTDNPLLLLAAVIALGVLMMFVYVPFFQVALRGGALESSDWLIALGFALLFLVADELRKWLQRRTN